MIGYSNAPCDDQGSYFLELEEIFKRNTFTRDEVDHLTKLLHSRSREVVFDSKEEGHGTSKEIVQSSKDIVTSNIGQRNAIGNTHFNNLSTPSHATKIMEDIASPVELAKAYMSSRPSGASTVGLRSQMFKGDVMPFRNPVFASTFSKTPSSLKYSANDIRDSSSMISRFHGRSSLYSMARTPYSRVHPPNILKGSSPMAARCEVPSSSRNIFQQNDHSNYKQSLKRRSSVLDDDDVPSSTPLRRTRQKQNLVIEKSAPENAGSRLSCERNYYNNIDLSTPSTSRYPLFDGSAIKDSLTQIDSRISRGSNLYTVPSQSTETAAKILQHLDKLVPSTKERMQVIRDTGEGSSALLAENSSHINEFKTFKNEDGAKSKQVVTSAPLDYSINVSVQKGGSSKTEKAEWSNENGTFASNSSAVSMAVSSKDSVDNSPCVEVTKSVIPVFSVQANMKRTFRMSAHEDYIDLDEDIKENSSSLLSVKAEPYCNGVVESRDPPAPLDIQKIQPAGKLKRPATSPVFVKISDPETPKKSSDFEKIDGFSFQSPSNQSMLSGAIFTGLVKPTFALPPPLPPAAESASSLNDCPNNKMESGSSPAFSTSIVHSNLLVENPTSNKHPTVQAASADVIVVPPKSEETSIPFTLSSSHPSSTPPPPKTTHTEPVPTLPSLPSSPTSPPPSTSTLPASSSTTTTTPFPPPSFSNTTSVNPFSSSSSSIPLPPSSSTSIFPTPTPFSSPFPISISSTAVNPFSAASSSSPSIFSSTAGSATNPISSLTASLTTTTPLPPIPPATTFSGFSTNSSGSINPVPSSNPFKFPTPVSNPFALPPSTSTKAAVSESKTAVFEPTPVSSTAVLFGSSAPSISSAAPTVVSEFPPLNIPNGPCAPLFQSSATPASTIFSFRSATPSASASKSSSGGGAVFGMSSPPIFQGSTGFSFGQRPAAPLTSPPVFGSGNSTFLFNSPGAAATAPGLPPAGFSLGPGNSDQMSTEDRMAEDNMTEMVPSTPALFSPPAPTSSFVFGGTPPAMAGSVFQFGAPVGQTGAPVGQTGAPFQPSGGAGFGGGGDFSMGSGGDKSNRKFVKVKHRQRRK